MADNLSITNLNGVTEDEEDVYKRQDQHSIFRLSQWSSFAVHISCISFFDITSNIFKATLLSFV